MGRSFYLEPKPMGRFHRAVHQKPRHFFTDSSPLIQAGLEWRVPLFRKVLFDVMFSCRLGGTKKIKGTMENLLRYYGLNTNANATMIVDGNTVVLGHATKLGMKVIQFRSCEGLEAVRRLQCDITEKVFDPKF